MPLWLPENEGHDSFLFPHQLRGDTRVAELRQKLHGIDPQLDVVYAKPGAKMVAKDDRWYIIRRTDTGIGGMWMCEDENGEHVFPNDHHIAQLRALDVQKHGDINNVIANERERAANEAKKAREAKSESFRTELKDRVDHLHDARISVPKDLTDEPS
jgi:hypothetical protein